MAETKQSLKAKLELMINLAGETWKLGDDIATSLAPNGDSDLYEILTEIQEHSRTDITEVMDILEKDGYFAEAKISEGSECKPASVKVNEYFDIELETPVDGGSLATYVSEVDFGTRNAGVMYKNTENYPVDIVYVEQKKGDIALSDGKPVDNADIDVYVYEDVDNEDYTRRFTLEKAAIDRTLSSED